MAVAKNPSLFTATDELAQVLGPELAKAFTDHRKALRKPMTGFAGQLMAKKLRGFPDPVAAVEQAILKGWTDVYPVEAPQTAFRPSTGIAAVEDQIRREISDHYASGSARQKSDDPEAVQGLSLLGWEGHDRPH